MMNAVVAHIRFCSMIVSIGADAKIIIATPNRAMERKNNASQLLRRDSITPEKIDSNENLQR